MKCKLPVHSFPRQFEDAVLEMMDQPEADPGMLRDDLANIRRINHCLGGHRLIRMECAQFFQKWPLPRVRVLDVCTGSADLPRVFVEECRSYKIKVDLLAIDRNRVMLETARTLSRDYPEIQFQEADALQLPFEENSFDLVMCNLALHHFSVENAITILQSLGRIAKHRLIVNDLHRGRMLCFGCETLLPLVCHNSMTRYDAALSARRAFTWDEMQRMAYHAGFPTIAIRHYFFGRQALIIDTNP